MLFQPTHSRKNPSLTSLNAEGYVALFGDNTGRQSVSISLCALLYAEKNSISSSEDSVNIMTLGDDLYSRLSKLSGQAYLMSTELPVMITIFDEGYELL